MVCRLYLNKAVTEKGEKMRGQLEGSEKTNSHGVCSTRTEKRDRSWREMWGQGMSSF